MRQCRTIVQVNAWHVYSTSIVDKLYPIYYLRYTIAKHFDTRTNWMRHESSYIIYRHEWHWWPKYRQIPIPYWHKKMWNPLYWYLKDNKENWYRSNMGMHRYIIIAQHNLAPWNCEWCSAILISMFGGHVMVRESMYTWVNIWVNATANHIDTRTNLLKHDKSYMKYRHELYRQYKYNQISIPSKTWKNLIIDIQTT